MANVNNRADGYDVENGTGLQVREGFNAVIDALLSNSSDGSEPTADAGRVAYMFWADTSTTPQTLKIRDSGNNNWIKICEVDSNGIGTFAGGQFFIGDGTIASPGLAFKDDLDTGLRRQSSGDNAGAVSIVIGAERRLTVNPDGDVGIGTADPEAQLNIKNADGNATFQLTSNTGGSAIIRLGDTGDANIGKIQYDNTDNSLAFTTNTSTRLTIDSSGNVGIAETTPTEVLHVNGNIKSTGTIFIGTDSTSPHAEDDGTTERVRIQQDQISVAAVGAAGLFVNRLNSNGAAAKFFKNGDEVGSISVTGSATAYNESSDHRLKENIVDMADGITRVKQLQPRRFNFIADAETTVDGFVAHEAQAVVPEAVTGTHNGVDENGDPVMQGIDKSKFVPLLTAALQEAIAKIETLEAKVAALEAAS